ncbi:MAG: S-methyl-5-thioribose-1-phosphate isomerase [Solirubrobacteraceae bacterium]
MAASSASPPVAALRWHDGRLEILDQTLLPARETWLELHDAAGTAEAIRRLAVRGAPNIGITAAYGLAMQVVLAPDDDGVAAAVRVLRAARPTAVNLAWAVDRVRTAVLAVAPAERAAVARAEAEAIHAAEDAASAAIALLGADLLTGARRILTHCNTGTLACGGTGSALAVVSELALRGPVSVLSCETRPLLQGARLTIWELRRAGIPHELLVDGAAAGLIRRGEVDAVIVGCDRVAANGDVANKVGTYAHALAAAAAGIPFVVAGPTSTIDRSIAGGDEIVIEERAADEVRHAGGALLTPADTPCRNPAFDVTPAELVTALVTERGIAAPPTRASVLELLTMPFGQREPQATEHGA